MKAVAVMNVKDRKESKDSFHFQEAQRETEEEKKRQNHHFVSFEDAGLSRVFFFRFYRELVGTSLLSRVSLPGF